MISIYIISAVTVLLIVYGAYEFRKHQKRVYTVPIRIHINGTRGKSSVTRLIGAGLRSAGLNAITKVTGTFPRMILADGTEAKIHRKEKANILEQLNIVKYCKDNNADAMVIECMALQPKYQKITETQMIHATIGVITNVRLDHLDVMGPTIKHVAKAISSTIPKNKILFTAEDKHFNYLQHLCQKKKTQFFRSVSESVEDEDMKGFNYIEHKENVALALDICNYLGVDKKTALEEMKKMIPDEGVLTKYLIEKEGKKVHFYNAFAANDPESSLMIWNNIKQGLDPDEFKIILLTVRNDRQSRAMQLLGLVASELDFDLLVPIGDITNIIEDKARKLGIGKEKIMIKNWNSPEKVFKGLLDVSKKKTTIVGIGNMGAMGAEVSQIFKLNKIK